MKDIVRNVGLVVALVFCGALIPLTALAEDCGSANEEEAAICEDTGNALSIVEELGIDPASSEGSETVQTLLAASCTNTQPQLGCIWGHCFVYCPQPTVPCSPGKSCRPRNLHQCSCQPNVRQSTSSLALEVID